MRDIQQIADAAIRERGCIPHEQVVALACAVLGIAPCGDHQDCGACINREDCGPQENIAEIARKAIEISEKATPEPWERSEHMSGTREVHATTSPRVWYEYRPILPPDDNGRLAWQCAPHDQQENDNLALIAYYRNHTPALAEEVLRLTGEVERLRGGPRKDGLRPQTASEMKNPTVMDIIKEYLKRHGYDGLYCAGECACQVSELVPGCDMSMECRAGHFQPCPPECGEHEWHIGPKKEARGG
jgi:hypothetical protein